MSDFNFREKKLGNYLFKKKKPGKKNRNKTQITKVSDKI